MWLKYLHVSCALLTFLGFNLRGFWALRGFPWKRCLWARVGPHVIDSLLFLSGLGLVLRLHQYPFVHGWLTAKLLGLLAYIFLGSIALRFAKSAKMALLAWGGADFTFFYIVAVAITHSPFPWQVQLF